MGKYCFGVDVGGTTVKLGLFNTSGDLMEKWEIPTVTEDDGKAILPDCAKSILKKMDERKMDRTEVVGVGIGAPGPVDSEGTLYGAVNLGWGTMSLKKELQTLLNMPVEAGNDANVAALGEAWQGGAKGYEDVVVVTLELVLAAVLSSTVRWLPVQPEPQARSDICMSMMMRQSLVIAATADAWRNMFPQRVLSVWQSVSWQRMTVRA